MYIALQYGGYLAILIALAIPLGTYISKVMDGERVFLTPILAPCERALYKLLAINPDEEMGWKKYAKCVLFLSVVSIAALMGMLMLQRFLPLNPQHYPGMNWDQAFNTAISFVTNTNWQSYSGESSLGYFAQAFGLTAQNFVSTAVGISVLFALIRGFKRTKQKGLGSFWVDFTRSIVYVLIPLALVLSLLLVSQGVVQNLNPYKKTRLLEVATTAQGKNITHRVEPMGPQASQIAIKQLGTNGGGFIGTNSASPQENPTILSNLLEMLSVLLIPVALCFAFGRSVGAKKQGRALFAAMLIVLLIAMGALALAESKATPQLAQKGNVAVQSKSIVTALRGKTPAQAQGNMEGKEARFGIAASSAWAAFTTAASSGSVNSTHDSYTPLGGMVLMILMQLGEVIFGGVGSGLYGMLGFVIFTVFIAGLMVGHTPEFLGKKIEPREMKMAVIVCLATPVTILVGSAVASLMPSTLQSLGNSGAHGFSELLYAFTSAGANNGSAFAGFDANTPFFNCALGVIMLFARFMPILATLAIAGSLVRKQKIAENAGTLVTTNTLFIGLLIIVILLVGALSFFPALALGPLAEHFSSLGAGM